MSNRTVTKHARSAKPKISEQRNRFEFIKASFAIEDIHFSEEELRVIEESIRKRHRGPGMVSGVKTLLVSERT